ncbi:MAG: hypothetical protein JNJ94_06325 [Chlorobi bacterium]|nr:hypothetical protein [Chlorobiota bacterium]
MASLTKPTYATLDSLTFTASPLTVGLTAICKHIERHCQDENGVQIFRSVAIGGDILADNDAPTKEETPMARLWCSDGVYRPTPAQFFLREHEAQCELILYYYSFSKSDLHRRQMDIARTVLSLLEQPASGVTGTTGIMPGAVWDESTQSFTERSSSDPPIWWLTRTQQPRIEHGNDYRTLGGVQALDKYWYATKIGFSVTAFHKHNAA